MLYPVSRGPQFLDASLRETDGIKSTYVQYTAARIVDYSIYFHILFSSRNTRIREASAPKYVPSTRFTKPPLPSTQKSKTPAETPMLEMVGAVIAACLIRKIIPVLLDRPKSHVTGQPCHLTPFEPH